MIEYGLEWHSLDSYFQFKEQSSAPGTPESGHLRVYAKDKSGTSALYLKDDAGNEREIGPANTVTGSGTTNRLAYWSSSSVLAANAALTQGQVVFPDSNGLPTGSDNLFWDGTNSELRVGYSTRVETSGATKLQIARSGFAEIGFIAADATGNPSLSFYRSRGSLGSESVVSADDILGGFIARGYDGTAYRNAARIHVAVDGTPGSSDMPGRIIFSTTPDGSTTLAERWRINASGELQGNAGGTILGGLGSGNSLSLQGSSHTDGGAVVLNNDTTLSSSAVSITPTLTNATGATGIQALALSPTISPGVNKNTVKALLSLPVFSPATGITITRASVLEFTPTTGSAGGTITSLEGITVGAPSLGTTVPTTAYGVRIQNQGVSGITTSIALGLNKPTNSTNNYYIEFDTGDATDPTSNGTLAAAGRIPILVGGALKYLPYYN